MKVEMCPILQGIMVGGINEKMLPDTMYGCTLESKKSNQVVRRYK